MGFSTQTDDATDVCTKMVGLRVRQAYADEGVADSDKRVWSAAVPQGIQLPYAILDVRSLPSALAGTKDSEPVQVFVTVRLFDTDERRARSVGARVQHAVTDRANPPAEPGWQVIWHDLVFHNPLNDVRETAPNIYGRVLEFTFHIEKA